MNKHNKISYAQSESFKSMCHVVQPRTDRDLPLPLRKLTKASLSCLVAFIFLPMHVYFPDIQDLENGAVKYLLHDNYLGATGFRKSS